MGERRFEPRECVRCGARYMVVDGELGVCPLGHHEEFTVKIPAREETVWDRIAQYCSSGQFTIGGRGGAGGSGPTGGGKVTVSYPAGSSLRLYRSSPAPDGYCVRLSASARELSQLDGMLDINPSGIAGWIYTTPERMAISFCTMLRCCSPRLVDVASFVAGGSSGILLRHPRGRAAFVHTDGTWDLCDGVQADASARLFLEALAQRLTVEPLDALDTTPPF